MIEYTALLYSTNGTFVDYENEIEWLLFYIDKNDKELIKIYREKLDYLINLYFED